MTAQRELVTSALLVVQLMPCAPSVGSKFDPEKKTIRFGSVHVVREQW